MSEKRIAKKYTWFNGMVLNDSDTKKYNDFSKKINDLKVESFINATPINALKNERFNFLLACFEKMEQQQNDIKSLSLDSSDYIDSDIMINDYSDFS